MRLIRHDDGVSKYYEETQQTSSTLNSGVSEIITTAMNSQYYHQFILIFIGCKIHDINRRAAPPLSQVFVVIFPQSLKWSIGDIFYYMTGPFLDGDKYVAKNVQFDHETEI